MAVTPAPLTDAIPLLNTDGVTGRNNVKDIRNGLITPLVLPTANEFVARQGVLARAWDGTAHPSMRVYANTTADRNVRISGGSCIITRTGEGAWIVHMTTATTTILCDPADATNPVVETVVARLYDRNISADNAAALHGPFYDVIRGVPGSPLNLNGAPGTAGAPPALPDGAIPLAYLSRAAGTAGDVIGNATNPITDKRKSTGLFGATRILLPGDAATDPGVLLGERRARLVNSVLLPMEYWGADNKWHGTSPFVYDTSTFLTGSANLSTTSFSVASITIPDPGWPYVVRARGSLQWTQGSNTWYDLGLRLSSATGTSLGQTIGLNNGGSLASGIVRAVDGASKTSAPLTGAQSVNLVLVRMGGSDPNAGAYAEDSGIFNSLSVDAIPV